MLTIRSLFKKKNDRQDPFQITHLEETDSTNTYIRQVASKQQQGDQPQDTPSARYQVVTAAYQSAGRGQGSNSWESERGKNLLFSILCHPVWIPITGQFILSEAIALAIRDALACYDSHFTIKWPNDIYWNDKKICGILIENTLGGGHIKDCILGVGLNVNQSAFHSDAPNPVSLYQILGHEVDCKALLQDILKRFDANIQATLNGSYAAIIGNYTSWLYRLHGFYPYRDGNGEFEAAIVEVEDDGHLVLRDREDRIRRYAFKEVEFIIKA